MVSFKTIISGSIKRRVFTREFYEEQVCKYLLHEYLTEEDAVEVLSLLDEFYPVEQPEQELSVE